MDLTQTRLVAPSGSFTDGYYGVNYPSSITCSWYIRPTPTTVPDVLQESVNDSISLPSARELSTLYAFPTVLVFTELDLEDGFDWIFVYEVSLMKKARRRICARILKPDANCSSLQGDSTDADDLLFAFTGNYPRKDSAQKTFLPQMVTSKNDDGVTVEFVSDLSFGGEKNIDWWER